MQPKEYLHFAFCLLSAKAYVIIFYGERGVWGLIFSVFADIHVL